MALNSELPPETLIAALDLSVRRFKVLQRAHITRLGELVLLTEARYLGLPHARSSDWAAIEQALRRSGIDRATVPLVYLIESPSLLTLLFHQGIRRVGDLLRVTDAELRTLPGMSPRESESMQHALARFGLCLRD